ncbi:hypothetical protein LJC12_01275 [Odoribacter sp. OttesenSCG-928-J03]|nr:hypothetical protein [Odoribacter sp. OttesenSCG-928-J03]
MKNKGLVLLSIILWCFASALMSQMGEVSASYFEDEEMEISGTCYHDHFETIEGGFIAIMDADSPISTFSAYDGGKNCNKLSKYCLIYTHIHCISRLTDNWLISKDHPLQPTLSRLQRMNI